MKAPATPANEDRRLERLRALGVMDTPNEQPFDDIVALASRLLDTPIALVSLVDEERQWFKARVGLDAEQTPREVSFCGHAVASGELLVVPDALADERFADNPLVTGEPRVRFYAGAPLTTDDGLTLGTLCVIDHAPRELTDDERSTLELLAGQVTAHLDLRRRAAQASFFDVTLDLLCIAGFDGYFKLLNPAWERVLGWSEKELLSRPFLELVHEEDRAATEREAARLASGEHAAVRFTHRFRSREAGYRWLQWSASPDGSGELIHAVARDVTERRQIDEMKNEFISVVSHELRTPLTSIRGSLRLMEGGLGGELGPKAKELVAIASKNTDRLVRLINDILDLEKIEAGKLELRLSDVDPRELAERAATAMHGLASEREVALRVEGRGPRALQLDEDRIMQVLSNLLSNAIKFSPRASEVTLDVRRVDSAVRFSVRDHGPGIDRADRLKVFEKFRQVDSSDTRASGGTGLGLAIAQALVGEHGGEIGVESELGQGATFYFDLPLTHRLTPLPADLPAEGAPRPRHSVLLVTEHRELARVLRLMLSAEGYRVRNAPTGADALAAARSEVPDAILVDIALGEEDGLRLVRHLREAPDLADVPVIATSAPGESSGAPVFADAMLVDWLADPLDEDSVVRTLRRAVRVPGPARVLVAEDDADVRAILARQLEGLGASVFEAEDGNAAIELARRHAPDLIVLDVGLPGIDGFHVVDVLKQSNTRSIPLVVYTGRDLQVRERNALRLGLTRHLTKARTSQDTFERTVIDLLDGVLPPPPRGPRGDA